MLSVFWKMFLLRFCPLFGFVFLVQGSDVLTDNFFDNLRGHPLIAGKSLDEGLKQLIEDQIHNYVTLATGEVQSGKKKRSLLDKFVKNDEGVFLLSGVAPSATIPVRFPEDLVIFRQNSQTFAAALESPSVKQTANYLVIFSYEDGSFTETARTPVVNGVKVATTNVSNSTLLAVAENDAAKDSFHNKSGIYQFDGTKLAKIQSIDMHFSSDVTFWKLHDEVYMSIANNLTEVVVYKWLGSHFDEDQRLVAEGVRRVRAFVAENANFLGLANFRDGEGRTRIYSHIYKYDYQSEKYQLHQRILTRGCTDLEVFSLEHDSVQRDTFLVVANSVEKDSDADENYEIESIIYKFIDDYFVPFQSIEGSAIERWVAVKDSGRFVLFASSRFDGLVAFQYDGWSFKKVPQKFPNLLTGGGLRAVTSHHFDGLSIVVANKNNNGKMANVFRLEFQKEEPLREVYEDMIQWCDRGLKTVEELSVVDPILSRAKREDVEGHPDEMKELEAKIDQLNTQLDGYDIGSGGFTAEEIIFNNVTFLSNLNVTRINGFQMDDFLDNVLDIDEGFDLGEARISTVEVDNLSGLNTVNGHEIGSLMHTSDDLELDLLSITGSLNLLGGVNIGGRLNGVTVTEKNLLLRNGDQRFSHPLEVENVTVARIVAKSFNGRDSISGELRGNLTVKNLIIGGYLNDVDLPTLEKFALKRTGDQEVFSLFVFDSLQGDNLEVAGKISGRSLSDLIDTQNGDHTIDEDLSFHELHVDDLQIAGSINGIPADDILWKNKEEEQEITGNKTFGDVLIQHAIFLQGHINSDYMDKMNPVVSIDGDVFLEGDRTITGGVEIENSVMAQDVATSGGVYSLARLEALGLRLTAQEVEPRLYFVQQLHVEEIFADQINGRNVTSFVVMGSEEPQLIVGVKTFLGDLSVEGGTDVLKINNVDVDDLESRILMVEGDQVVSGKHHVKRVIADGISTADVAFDHTTPQSPDVGPNLTIPDDFSIDAIRAKTIHVTGSVNGVQFDEMVEDTVTTNTTRTVTGHKFFENLTVFDLDVRAGLTIDEMPDEIQELTVSGPLQFDNIQIKNLHFGDKCNGVSDKDLGKGKDDTVHEDLEFESIIVYGRAYIASNKINGVDIGHLARNSVKIDEPHDFTTLVTFEDEVVSKAPIRLDGQIENFDFDNIVLSDQFNSTIFDEKIFASNLTVNGSVHLRSFINGFNMTQFCQFTTGEIRNANLTIDGNVFFAKGPNVAKINDVSTKRIKEKAWFEDRDTTLEGTIDFEDVVFKDDVRVDGFVDNISLALINDNYFSKSKDQNITATFMFEADLIFEKEITVPTMMVEGGMINDMNLDEFVRTALLDDYDQVFETVVFLENCFVQNLTGEFTVNGLELDKDVMLYDGVNMVTGPKTFKNLNVEHLKLVKNIKIQNVDVLGWFKNCVLRTHDCNLTGTNTFKNAHFEKGFLLGGTLNGLSFTHADIMLKNLPQEITGSKTIRTDALHPVSFKGIKLKGLLNGLDVSDLVNNQAYMDQDNVFKTSLNFYNNVSTNNLVIKKMWRGVNMTELMGKIENLGVLNNLVDQYDKLLAMSYSLRESVEGHAYFLHHYKIIQTINPVADIRKIVCPDGVTRLGILANDISDTRMDLYGWQPQEQQFSVNATIRFDKPFTYVDQVLMGRYLYTEAQGTGNFLRMDPLTNVARIFTNTTIGTHSFVLPTTYQPCAVFIYSKDYPRIFCESETGIGLRQTLPLTAVEATSITISDTLYLAFITQPGEDLEAFTDIWRSENGADFQRHQSLFEAHPQSVSTVSHRGHHFLAIASGHLQNAMYSGSVKIGKFDESSEEFAPWQSLELEAPVQVEFSILPTEELVLYVLADNPTQPLSVFRYEGVAGFREKVARSVLPQMSRFLQISSGAAGRHFVVGQGYGEIDVIEAVFYGEKVRAG